MKWSILTAGLLALGTTLSVNSSSDAQVFINTPGFQLSVGNNYGGWGIPGYYGTSTYYGFPGYTYVNPVGYSYSSYSWGYPVTTTYVRSYGYPAYGYGPYGGYGGFVPGLAYRPYVYGPGFRPWRPYARPFPYRRW